VQLIAGARLRSTVCPTEVIVTRAPAGDVDLTCGAVPMVPIEDAGAPSESPAVSSGEGTVMGKRYVDESGDLELLCTKPGHGSLARDGTPLTIRGAKPLPSSD
jgi:hypothetical protein